MEIREGIIMKQCVMCNNILTQENTPRINNAYKSLRKNAIRCIPCVRIRNESKKIKPKCDL